VLAMEGDFLGDIDVGNPIAVGETKVLFVSNVGRDALETAAGQRSDPQYRPASPSKARRGVLQTCIVLLAMSKVTSDMCKK
jgi:hypothetical protein